MLFDPRWGPKQASPLAYPAGRAPGFDWSHPASQNCLVSAVSAGGAFINLLNGKPSTQSGSTIGGLIDGNLGPATSFSGSTAQCGFTGLSKSTLVITQAAFFRLTNGSLSANAVPLAAYMSAITTSTNLLVMSSNNHFAVSLNGGTSVDLGVVCETNVPYFFAISYLGTSGSSTITFNYIIVRLDTGSMVGSGSSSGSATAGGDPPQTYTALYLGNAEAANRIFPGSVSEGMLSACYLSMPLLRIWAADPWAFWYPRGPINLVGVAAAAFKPYFALSRNRVVEGVAT